MKAYDRSAARAIRAEDVDDPLAPLSETPRHRRGSGVMQELTIAHRAHLLDHARRLRDRIDAEEVVQDVLFDAARGAIDLPPDIDAAVDTLLEHIVARPSQPPEHRAELDRMVQRLISVARAERAARESARATKTSFSTLNP